MTAAASALPYAACAAACLAWAALALGGRRAAWASTLACAMAGLWAAAVALSPERPLDGTAGVLETLRAGAWMLLLLVLHRRLAGRTAFVRHAAVAALLLCALSVAATLAPSRAAAAADGAVSLAPFLRIGLALLTLLLVENVWRNADDAGLWHVSLPCVALGGLAAFDLLLYAHAGLSGAFSGALLDARAGLTAVALALLAVSASRDRRWRARPRVSRAVVFHGATLLVAGGFLLGIGLLGEALRRLGPAWGEAAQAGLLAVALLGTVAAASVRSVRSRLRRLVVDHFFAARYDYRSEWLRCVAALSTSEGEAPVRAIRAIADAVDSPGGVLLLRRAEAAGPSRSPHLDWAGAWNRPAQPFAIGPGSPILAAFGTGERVAVLNPGGEAELPPDQRPLWLAVPLLHHGDEVFGAVLLAPPRAPFPLDEEVFALLRIIGREVALVLAERRAAERLAEGERLAEHARRFAFVAHDLKTVASQLGMILANAEEHMSDPEFQGDMLLTARASAARMNALIARLRTAEADDAPPVAGRPAPEPVRPAERLRALAAARHRAVEVVEDAPVGAVAMAPEAFDSAVTHLLDNAIEASSAPVTLRLWTLDGRPMLDIADRGPGMTERFVLEELFRPLSTTKPRGSGIGAWQARELLRAAGGDLTALSAPGVGTVMRLSLPPAGFLAAAPTGAVADDARRAEMAAA